MSLEILRAGERQPARGAAETFAGEVFVERLYSAAAPARVQAARVRFAPGARTAWHTHPLGQLLVIESGVGRVQAWGEPVQEVREGDVIWTPPGVKHWHGAAPDQPMTHLAIQEALDGRAVEWMEHVEEPS